MSAARALADLTMKVLIIDDEPMVRLALGYALSAMGWEVYDHDEHADFPALIRQHGIDAVISDYKMVSISGLDLIENIRNAGIEIPILILSANTYAIDRARAKRLRVREIVEKPPNLRRLCSSLEEAITAGNKGGNGPSRPAPGGFK